MTDPAAILASLRTLHRRRKGSWFWDGTLPMQTTWPDKCEHCRQDWPCATVRIMDGAK